MNPVRAFKVAKKDLKFSPRSPIFLYALFFPVVITLVIQVAFGSLFDPQPRLGIVDKGDSEITALISAQEGIDLTLLESASELKRRVRDNDLDAGLVLKEGFDKAVRSGEKPLLEFYVGGESLASNRVVLAVTTLDVIREIEGKVPPVEVIINTLGDGEDLPISSRLIPLMVLFALLIAGVFVTAFGFVEERESKTLDAVLATPVKLSEVLIAKAGIGLILSVFVAFATLLLNGALGPRPAVLLLALVIAALMAVEFGIIYAIASKDIKTLFALIKTLNLILMAPVIFYIFPDWPQWIARIFPTYWLINPIFEIAVKGSGLRAVAFDLGIALGICVVLMALLMGFARRMQARMAV